MRKSVVLVALLSLGFAALGQEGELQFEVASVRPATARRLHFPRLEGGPGSLDPERINYTDVTLRYLLMAAYGVQEYQVSGPAWLTSELYDIVAKLPPGTTKEELQGMFRTLLEERFNVSLHHEARSMSVYKLTAATVRAECRHIGGGITPNKRVP